MSLQDEGSDRQRLVGVVDIDDLKVDHRYQRELNQSLVERIMRDWDMVAADSITVSARKNGSLYIVDGQHRAAAAKLSGETEMLAFVYDGLTVAQEADLRLKSGNRRPDTSLERFYAQVTAGNREARAIVKLLEAFDTHINRSANSSTGINCVSTIEFLYRDSEGLLVETLNVLQEAHGQIGGEVATVAVLRGTAWFLKAHRGEFSRRALVERLKQYGPEDLVRRARNHRAVSRGPIWLNYYRSVVETYNYRRQPHTRIEATTKHWGQRGWGERST